MQRNHWLPTWHKLSIKSKFGLVSAGSVAIIVALALTSFFTLSAIRHQMETTITASFQTQRLVLEMDKRLQDARILERDFFWRWPTIGYDAAQVAYIQPHRDHIAKTTALGAELQQILAASESNGALRQNDPNVQQYLAAVSQYARTFDEAADLVAQLGAQPDGAEAVLVQRSKILSDALPASGNLTLTLLYRQMASAEKTYLITHQAVDLQPMFDESFRMHNAIENATSLDATQRPQVVAYLDDYLAAATQIQTLNGKITSKIDEVDKQAQAVDPLAEALINSANADVQNAQASIAQVNQSASTLLGLMVALAIGAAVLVAIALNVAITRRVIGLTTAAGALQRGDFQARVPVNSSDELGQLGNTFNAMADRLQETLTGLGQELTQRRLVEDELRKYQGGLEELVAARTAEVVHEKQHLEALVTNIPVAIVVAGAENRVVSWNPAAHKLFGYTQEQAIGRLVDDLVTNQATSAEAAEYSQQLTSGMFVQAITQRYRKDGTPVDVELLGVPVVVGGEQVGTIAIYHDITELQGARQEAEAANQAKSAFLATMSHEIRTPMNGIIGMTSLLLDTELSPEQRDYAETIRGSGETLLTIINDILDFSKIEAGKMELENQPFDLRECVESAFDLVAARAREKRLELAYSIDSHTPATWMGDVTRLRQILLNLLSNAIKFTDRGEVIVSVDVERKAVTSTYLLHFSVRDTGIGIAPERRDRLFQSFTQVDASTTRKYGGTGLGLAISKRLSEIMGGTMWVESQIAEGSTFHFTIQAEAAPVQVSLALHNDQPQLQDRHVLIVDDNDTNRRILVAQARSWNMLPRETAFPQEAIDWVRRGDPFDVALLDMQMPDIDGMTLSTEIRRFRDPQSLPIVILSSLDRRELGAQALQFAAYLTKPIKQSQLHDTLVTIFAGQTITRPREGSEMPQFDTHLAERVPLRILVAEDNVVNQKLAQQMLHKMGYRSDVVGNGIEVLQALERQPYDLVLMDVQMPDMDGLEATRCIVRQWLPEKRPRIIAMTANAMQGDREECLAAGMDDYISKPIQVKALQIALERWGQHGLGLSAPISPPRIKLASVDWSVLDAMRAFQEEGEPDFVQSMMQLYLTDSPPMIKSIHQAILQSQPEALRNAAHALKGNSNSLGATQMGALSLELETLGRNGKTQGAEPLFVELEREFERVRLAFTANVAK